MKCVDPVSDLPCRLGGNISSETPVPDMLTAISLGVTTCGCYMPVTSWTTEPMESTVEDVDDHAWTVT